MFRLGELHIVFAMLKALGKYINNSGLHQAFAEAQIYGPATNEQIKHDKRIKRSFEGNTTLNVALFCVYMENFVSFYHSLRKNCERDLPTL